MKLFSSNKKEQKETPNEITIDSFRKEYIWGFTQRNPMYHSSKKDDFYNLIKPLTGENGTVTIGASFHPYQLIDKSGNDIWETLFNVVKINNFCNYHKLIEEKFFFHMVPPGPDAFPFLKWKDDRLYHEINPEFSKYVPFLIPYLTYDNKNEPVWLTELNQSISSKGNAHEFINKINAASRFFLPEPTFIIGFGIFDKNNLGELINNYVDFLNKHIKK